MVSAGGGIESPSTVLVVPLVVAIVRVYRGVWGEKMRLAQALRLL